MCLRFNVFEALCECFEINNREKKKQLKLKKERYYFAANYLQHKEPKDRIVNYNDQNR